jgi:hypothetical protein
MIFCIEQYEPLIKVLRTATLPPDEYKNWLTYLDPKFVDLLS